MDRGLEGPRIDSPDCLIVKGEKDVFDTMEGTKVKLLVWMMDSVSLSTAERPVLPPSSIPLIIMELLSNGKMSYAELIRQEIALIPFPPYQILLLFLCFVP